MSVQKDALEVMWDPEKFYIDQSGRSIGIFARDLPRFVDFDLIEQLKQTAMLGSDKNARLCLHDSPDALFHSMIIVEKMGNYSRPHRHQDKGECFHIVEGALGVLSFDDKGTVTDRFRLDPKGIFMGRIPVNSYHAVIPLSRIVIYHESKPGPFLRDNDSLFPSWAPDGSNRNENEEYSQRLLEEFV